MRRGTRLRRFGVVAIAIGSALGLAGTAVANVTVTTISTDTYTNTTSFHATEVEPDTFAYGSTIVAAFQVGRYADGGASTVGWATSTDGGTTWSSGPLPGVTKADNVSNPYDRDTDPSVAYDAQDGVWLIASLPLDASGGGVSGVGVIVNRSTDGTTWGNPVTVAAAGVGQDLDKSWIACDNTASSPHYGNCYAEYDDFGHSNRLHMATSTDGGLTWFQAKVRSSSVIGGQPVVAPSGRVIVPIDNGYETAVGSFISTNGGVSYKGPYTISSISSHAEAGNLRSGPLPSAEIDGAGKVYVVWSDCRFRSKCPANDIVMSTSTNGIAWSSVVRIPIDATTSGVDRFLPGLAVDPGSSGTTAKLGLSYYFYPSADCTTATCQLDVGYVSSSDGGTGWSSPTQLQGPMTLGWLPLTTQGYMVGDYASSSFAGATVHPVFAVAEAVAGKTCTLGDVTSCNEYMVSPSSGLSASSVAATLVTREPVLFTGSGHVVRGRASWR